MIKLNWFIPIFLLFALLYNADVKAEGLKELANGTTNYPVTSFGSNGWADPGAPEERRLHIYIEDPTSESVYFGFSRNNETYNVFDPNGNLVFTNTSNANCGNAAVAIAGPMQVVGVGGYDASGQVYTPAAGSPAGNYYIEFDGSANMSYWDISVAKSGNTSTELGRLWSMIWWLDMGSWSSSASFEATMYAYSTEGFVSKVDYKNSNFRPYVFSIYYNATGPGNTGDLVEDRKSVNGSNAGTPSFPVFLNPPPEAIMPSATFGDIVATPSITRTAATGSNKYSFNLSSTQPGTFTVLLNVYNESVPDVYDAVSNTTDRMIVFNVEPEPGETPPYVRAIPWDGIDGNGNTLPDGYLLHYTVYYGDGRSHFPTYDAEYLADGLTVSQVRPSNSYNIELYWDDSNIPDDPTTSTHGDFSNLASADKVELNGAATPNHKWVNDNYGNVNTINTWWYCNVKQEVEQVEPLPPLATAEPDTQAHHIVFSEIGNTAMKINWTNGNGTQRVVFMAQTTTGQAFPVDGTTYAASTTFGAGDQIGASGWYCIYNGADSPELFVEGLAENTDYRVMVCEYNVTASGEDYNINTAVDNPANQTTITLTQATNVTFSNVLANSMTVDWTNGTGTRRVAFIKLTATAGDALPVDNTTYTASSVYGVGDQIGSSGWYCIYNGTGSSVDLSNLAANTDYTVMVCEYLGSDGNQNYLTVTNATDPNNQITSAENPAHHIVFSNVTTNSMQIDWTDGTGDARYVFVKETTSTIEDAAPVDGTVYAPNTVWSTGDQIGTTGWYCVYAGTGSSVTITGLSQSTTYRVKVADYDGAQVFIPGTLSTNPLSQSTLGTTPNTQACNIVFTNTGATSMDVNWTNGSGTKRVVFAKQGNTGSPTAVDATVYAANSGFGLGDQIGSSGWYCIYNGTGSSVTMNNILQATEYRFKVCEYNTDGSGPLYNNVDTLLNPNNNTSLTAGITVSNISQHTTEAGGTATFTIVLNTQPTHDVVIGLSSDDTGEGTVQSSVSFSSADWDIAKTITVTGQDDAIFDGDINYNIITAAVTSSDSNYDGIDPDDVAVINDDNEAAPIVDLSVSPASIAEDGSSSTITATLSVATYEDVTVTIAASNGTAESGDYTLNGTNITILAGSTTGTETLSSTVDAIYEGDETVLVDITAVSGGAATENGTQQETITIVDDEAAPTVDLSVSPASIAEDGSSSTITATLSVATYEDVTVTIAASNGTAESGDYTLNGTSITILAGTTTGTETLSSTVDAIYEGDETVLVDITAVSGGAATENGTQQETITIVDDEAAPTVDLSVSPASIAEDGSSSTITATLSVATYEDVTVTIAASNGTAESGDYTLNGTSITILAGSTTGTETLSSTVDAIYEGDETVLVDITAVSGGAATENGTQQETITIVDDEAAPTVDLSVSPASIAEDGSSSTITATLSVATYEDVTVTIAASNGTAESGDYTLNGTSITILAGSTTGTETLSSTVDAIYEGDETVLVDITAVSGGAATENGTQQETITIVDDEAAPTVSLSASPLSIAENGGVSTLTATLNNATTTDVTVTLTYTGTATGSDYTAASTMITILAGSTTGTTTITSVDDVVIEGDETVIASITNITNASAGGAQSATVTIIEDDFGPTAQDDDINLPEDNGATNLMVLNDNGNGLDDFGADGPSTGTITITSMPTNGSAVVNDNGTANDPSDDYIVYTPNLDYNGADAITYEICDATGDCDQATVNITVDAVNDAPVVDNENVGTLQDTPFSGDLIDMGDTDVDGNLTANTTPLYGPFNGGIVINTDGTYTYTPNAGYFGNDTIVVEICDDGTPLPAICVNDTIFMVVTANATPVDVAGNGNEFMSTTEDASASNSPNVLDNNMDPEGDPMNVVVVNPGNGTVVFNPADSTLAYTPNPDFCGQDTVLYDVCDANTCNHDTLFVDVACVNDSPTAGNEQITIDEDNPIAGIDLDDNNTDVDGDPLTVNFPNGLVGTGGGTFIDNGDGTVDYTPAPDFYGNDTLIYTVCDPTPACVTDTLVVTVNPINDAPVVDNENVGTTLNVPFSGDLTDIGDTDVDGILTANTTPVYGPLNGGIIINPDGTYTYTPNTGFMGNDTIVVEICDDGFPLPAICVNDTIFVVVTDNLTPVDIAGTDGNENMTTTEDSGASSSPNVLDNNEDPEGDPMNVVIVNSGNGTAVYNPADSTIIYTPNPDFCGQDTVLYDVCDAYTCNNDTLFVEVICVNDTPELTDGSITTEEDSVETVCLAFTDVDGVAPYTVTTEGCSTNGIASVEIQGDEVCITYTPDENFNGLDSVCVTLCDFEGACVTDTIPVVVTPVNDDPVVTEDTLITSTPVNVPVEICITATDADLADEMSTDTLGICGFILDPVNGVTADVSDISLCFSYVPNIDYIGYDTLTVLVCDGNGGSDTVSVVIDVTPDNNPAEITDTTIITIEDSTVTVCIPFTDPDGVGPYTATIGDCSENGTASVEVLGDEVCITYIPDLNFNGLDSVCVTLCDAENVCVTDTIPVVVDPVNDIPELPDTVITTIEDSTITVCLQITDEDGVAPYTATLGDCAENGIASAEVNGNEVCITYIPNPNFNGLDSLCITICDAESVCLTDTIPVVVEPVNDYPEITDTTITTHEDSTITVCVPFTDEDGESPYTATIGDCTENGTASVEVQGDEVCITYIPNPSYSGLDTICLTLCDAENACVTDTIPVDVIPFDPTPDALDDIDTSRIGEIVIDILENDINVNDTTSVSIVDEPNNGTAELDGNNNIVYTPDLEFCGTDTISYQICNEGICDQATVYINVIPMDSDEDGIADYIETTTADTDNDGTPNYLDLDSDGDGIPDAVEALGDLSDPCDPILADTDNDGIDDYVDLDSDDDGVSDKDENDPNGDGEGPDDSDGDGIDDYRDTDDDDDGVSTSDEIETNGNGHGFSDCDEDDIPDYLDPDPCSLSIPQGFSPNGDNVNDVFVIQRAIGTGDINIEIYNRWGNKVYEAVPYENDWDGTNMFGVSIGDELPVGTYFYIIEVKDKIYKGYIYLNR